MDFKLLVVVALAVLGVAVGSTIPNRDQRMADLEASFASSYGDQDGQSPPSLGVPPPSQDEVTREKRDLLKKLFKKGGHETYVVNHRYQQEDTYGRPGREVHHHHYPYAPPIYEQRPPNNYHHYHGYESGYSQQGGYQSGGYSSGGNYYGNNYGAYPQPQSGPIGAAPQASGHNAVDRGQGAAAVNNIAIIHARSRQPPNGDQDSPVVDMQSMSHEGF